MATISAKMVKDLRNKTDLPMMECKQALSECNGDMEAATDWLRKKYKGKLADRADRATGEGRIGICIDEAKKIGGIVQLQCETAPVAKNDLFMGLSDAFATLVAGGTEASPSVDAIRHEPKMDEQFTEVFGRLRESMNLTGCRRIEAPYVVSYVHHDGKSGVMLGLDAAPKSDKNIGADLCMHTLFSMPIAIDRSAVPAEKVEKIRNDAREMATAEGKPDHIVDKIVEGKVNAFYAEQVLLEQIHVKTDDYGKTKIADCLKDAGVSTVTDMVIMRIGS